MGIPQCEHTETVLCRWACHVCQSVGLRSPIEGESPSSKEAVAACPHMEELPVCARDAKATNIESHMPATAHSRSECSTLFGTPYAAASSSDIRCLDFRPAARGGSESCSTLGNLLSSDSNFAVASNGHLHNSTSSDIEQNPMAASPSHIYLSADAQAAAVSPSIDIGHTSTSPGHAADQKGSSEGDLGSFPNSAVANVAESARSSQLPRGTCESQVAVSDLESFVAAASDLKIRGAASDTVADADAGVGGVADSKSHDVHKGVDCDMGKVAADSVAQGADHNCHPSASSQAEVECILPMVVGTADSGRENPASDCSVARDSNSLVDTLHHSHCLVSVETVDSACTLPSVTGDFPVVPSASMDIGSAALDSDDCSQHSAPALTHADIVGACPSFVSDEAEYATASSAFNLGDMDFNIAAFQDVDSPSSKSAPVEGAEASSKDDASPGSQNLGSLDTENAASRDRFASFDLVDLGSSNVDVAANHRHSHDTGSVDCRDSDVADSPLNGLADSSCKTSASADAEFSSPRNRFTSFDLVDLEQGNQLAVDNKKENSLPISIDCADSCAVIRVEDTDSPRPVGDTWESAHPDAELQNLDSVQDDAGARKRTCSFDFIDLDSGDGAAENRSQTSLSASLECRESDVADGADRGNHLATSASVDDPDSIANSFDCSTCQEFTSPDAEHASPRNRFSSFDLVDLDPNSPSAAENVDESPAAIDDDGQDVRADAVADEAKVTSAIVDEVDADSNVLVVDGVAVHTPTRREADVRHIFLVRHVQSQWNVMMKAFKDVDIRGMYDSATAVEGVDHPLSEEGLRQAEELQNRIQTWRAPSDPACPESDRARAFYEAFYLAKRSEILCSPQRRAVQTADRTLPVADGWPSIKLIQEARELKNHMFEFDNVSTEDNIGEQIAVNAGLAAHAGRVDSSECTDRWWPEGVDSDDQREVRAKALWRRLEELKSRSCIVVTHSNLIKQLANFIIRSRILDKEVDACGSDQWDFCIVPKIPEDLERARSSKLRNGGVLGLQCRFEMPDAHCPDAQTSLTVEDALLMFESEFEDAPHMAAASA